MYRSHRIPDIAGKGVQIEFAVVGTDHEKATLVQDGRTVCNQRHQVFPDVKVRTLESGKAGRIQNDAVELEAFLLSPVNVLDGVTTEEFPRAQIQSIQLKVLAALVQNLSANVGIGSDFSTAEARLARIVGL